jgi:hypothetical protein
MELGIRLGFVKTSEFGGGGGNPTYPLRTPLVTKVAQDTSSFKK